MNVQYAPILSKPYHIFNWLGMHKAACCIHSMITICIHHIACPRRRHIALLLTQVIVLLSWVIPWTICRWWCLSLSSTIGALPKKENA